MLNVEERGSIRTVEARGPLTSGLCPVGRAIQREASIYNESDERELPVRVGPAQSAVRAGESCRHR